VVVVIVVAEGGVGVVSCDPLTRFILRLIFRATPSCLFGRGYPFWVLTSQLTIIARSVPISQPLTYFQIVTQHAAHNVLLHRDPIFAPATSCRVCSDRYAIEHEKSALGCGPQNHRWHLGSDQAEITTLFTTNVPAGVKYYVLISVHRLPDIHRRDKVCHAQP